MRLDSRAAITCHEYLHKTLAPNSFPGLLPDPENPVAKEFEEQGLAHERKFLELLHDAPGVVHIDINASREEQQIQTAEALLNPKALIITGADIGQITEEELAAALNTTLTQSNRASRPDLLIRISANPHQWAPVDIKSHTAVEENKSNSVYITPIADFNPTSAEKSQGRLNTEDLHQLAHYTRHLQALGLATDQLWCGIIGRDIDTCAWVQLGDVVLGLGKNQYAFLDEHDQKFATALDKATASYEENSNPSQKTGIIPENLPGKMGCMMCEYKSTCLAEMEAFDNGAGHVTLLATVTPREMRKHFPEIASIATLRSTPPTDDFMAKAQVRAKVWKSEKPQLLDPATPLDLPEFDIEIDIDLENSMVALRELLPDEEVGDDRLYLYGFGIHDRTTNPSWKSATIETISDYSNTAEGEYRVMLDVWNRLHQEIKKAESAGKTIGIFHYSPHEKTWWRNFARRYGDKPGVPTFADVENFANTYLIDLYKYTQKISFPTMGYSIKLLAPLAGFKWSVKDPGGAGSLLKYRDAINPALPQSERDAAIAWLDSYNRDDVRATFAVRDYIRNLSL